MMDSKKLKQLREISGAGVLDCQKALKESRGDLDRAMELLRKKGQKIAQTKESRSTNEGIIESYIHSNKKIGVLVQLVCETDFVARGEEFKQLAHDLAMQVAATNPLWISPEDIPLDTLEKEKEIYSQDLDSGKPQNIREQIINGKLQKFYSETCLLNQRFIKDETITIKELIQNKIARLGENISVKRFIRFIL